ncbi:CocE/NonD family hydrolase [Alkalinema pantanalense CENA528]|uniref:CocE/NonD family hydrolase n=1 Tax=Alkalinema pantanalense TaxID=1620705 RepID=UPI003D6ECB3D
MLPVRPPQTRSLLSNDGIRLDADIYTPDRPGDFPVLLMRQPYGRAIASTVVYAHPAWYAAHGYIVVIQDVRGRGSSEGEFRLFASEISDGEASVHWAANLPQSNGSVGMYGFSYQGMTQLYAAVNRPAPLKALCPAMLANDLYADWAYEGDAFCLQANLGWAIQLAAETARRLGNEAAFLRLRQAAQHLPLQDSIPANPELLQHLAPDSFYHDWLHRPSNDSYWATLSPKTYHDRVADLPMLHIGGWFDPYLRGTLNLYQALADRQQAPQHLIIGPWAHLPWGRKTGIIDYGNAAVSPVDRLQIRWFDYWLKGIDNGITIEHPVQLFAMGSNTWQSLKQLPTSFTHPPTHPPSHPPTLLHLHPTGLASMSAPLAAQPPTTAPTPDRLVHDPWRPVPAIGGHASAPAGVFDRASLDDRSDVLTYTTEPCTEPWHLRGTPIVHLTVDSDAVSFDLCAVLSQVLPNGQVLPIAQGYRRVQPSPEQAIESPITLAIPLQATYIQIPADAALRLSISAACFPAYPVNPGTGTLPAAARTIDAQIITLQIHAGSVQFDRSIVTEESPKTP